MRRFASARPTALADAVAALSLAAPGARLLAGGTDLVVGLRDDTIQPGTVIDLKAIGDLDATIVPTDEGLRIGALAVMRDIEEDPRILQDLPALAEAARTVGAVQIRNRATLAGNICNASPAADTAPPLLVYGAVVDVVGPGGERRIAIDDFFIRSGVTGLEAGEIVRSITVPVPAAGDGSAYTRLVRRRGTDLASVTMAAAIDTADVVILSYGSVGPRPFLVRDDSGILADAVAPPDEKDVVLERLLSLATPSATSGRAGPDYRLAMLPVLARRAITAALARRQGDTADA